MTRDTLITAALIEAPNLVDVASGGTAAAALARSAAVPRHVAIIMDGNGRWAKARGLPRLAGHKAGAASVRRTIEAAVKGGVDWLTLYAFSSENWQRPADEVSGLTALMRHYLRHEIAELHAEGVRLRVIGERDRFGADTVAELARAERLTEPNTRLNLTIALSYGGRSEIALAARRCAEAVLRGEITPADIDEAEIGRHLATSAMPDPDLVIRTSGERRISNFLLFQSAYSEFVFSDVLWPDFGAEAFGDALAEFARRQRRFGARPV